MLHWHRCKRWTRLVLECPFKGLKSHEENEERERRWRDPRMHERLQEALSQFAIIVAYQQMASRLLGPEPDRVPPPDPQPGDLPQPDWPDDIPFPFPEPTPRPTPEPVPGRVPPRVPVPAYALQPARVPVYNPEGAKQWMRALDKMWSTVTSGAVFPIPILQPGPRQNESPALQPSVLRSKLTRLPSSLAAQSEWLSTQALQRELTNYGDPISGSRPSSNEGTRRNRTPWRVGAGLAAVIAGGALAGAATRGGGPRGGGMHTQSLTNPGQFAFVH